MKALIRERQKKKILVLASTFPRWKNDTTPPFVYELEKRLTKDFTIFVLAPHCIGAKKKEKVDGLTIHRFQYFWPARHEKLCYSGGILPNLKKNKLLYFQAITFLFFECIAALKIIKNEKIHIVHAHWVIPQGIVALVIKQLFHVPYIVTTHGGDIYGVQNPLFVYIKKIVLIHAEKITVVSNAIKNEINQKIESDLPIEVIPMGVDSMVFNPNKYDVKIKEKYDIKGPFLLFVGRLAEKKGVAYLLRAMSEIILKFPTVKLLIIGEGTMEKELIDTSKDLGIKEHTIFMGPVSNVSLSKYYATADIFIGPSIKLTSGDTEGLGLTFVEAALSGCIPIGSNIGGIPDVIENNKNGFLVKEKDFHQIADTVIKILQNSKLAEQIKQVVRKSTVEKFDWVFIADKYKQLYLEY